MNGSVWFGTKNAGIFSRKDSKVDIWNSTNGMIATRQGNDLLVKNGEDAVTIKDYFKLSKHITMQGSHWSGLGIHLIDDTPPTDANTETAPTHLWVGDSHPILDENGNYKNEWNNRDSKTGKIIGGVNEADFNDIIQSDNNDSIIKGLGGHDALSGGQGNDVIEAWRWLRYAVWRWWSR